MSPTLISERADEGGSAIDPDHWMLKEAPHQPFPADRRDTHRALMPAHSECRRRRYPALRKTFYRSWRNAMQITRRISSPPAAPPRRGPRSRQNPGPPHSSRASAIPIPPSRCSIRASPNIASSMPASSGSPPACAGARGRCGSAMPAACCGATFPTTGSCAGTRKPAASACSASLRITPTATPATGRAASSPASMMRGG